MQRKPSQRGIDRLKQRKGDMEKGQGGKMGNKPKQAPEWKRPNNTNTPVKA